MLPRPRIPRLLALGVALAACVPLGSSAQEPAPPPPTPSPYPPPIPTEPALPDGDSPEAVAARLRLMERKLDALIGQNEQLARENRRLSEQYDELSRRVHGQAGSPAPASDSRATADSHVEASSPASDPAPHASGGGSKASGGDPTTTGRAQQVGNRHVGKIPLKPQYDFDNDGFGLATEDDEIELRIRGMTQLDARVYEQADQSPVSGGIYNPRTRIYFEGQFTRPIQYEFSLQNTFDTVNLLDAYVNWNYDPRFQVRVGRFKNPHTYEWYRVHVWHLLAPERSLFTTNFEANRRFGVMAHGSLFDRRVEYAVGTFNGQRNSFTAFDNSQNVTAFLNIKPFEDWEGSPLRDFQFGGSVDAGYQNQSPIPAVLRTSSPPSGAELSSDSAGNIANVPILAFNDDVRERGVRALWELHAAYYYKGLSLMGAWDSGYQGYGIGAGGSPSVRVPTCGYFVQVGYLVTGETLRDRTLIDPLRPFDLRPGHFGLGALELSARYSELSLGREVFTQGLANPNLWTNRAEMTDVGFNWYLNKFVKVYFDWEHAMFATPVRYAPGPLRQKTSDLFWARFQVYF